MKATYSTYPYFPGNYLSKSIVFSRARLAFGLAMTQNHELLREVLLYLETYDLNVMT